MCLQATLQKTHPRDVPLEEAFSSSSSSCILPQQNQNYPHYLVLYSPEATTELNSQNILPDLRHDGGGGWRWAQRLGWEAGAHLWSSPWCIFNSSESKGFILPSLWSPIPSVSGDNPHFHRHLLTWRQCRSRIQQLVEVAFTDTSANREPLQSGADSDTSK